jgi:protein-tyrosine phosphatase
VATVGVDLVGSLNRPPDGSVEQMLRLLLDGCRAEVARAIDEVARLARQSPPVVFHCHTGKDRTGLIAIVLLSLASVPEEAIIADYMASNPGFEAMRAALTAGGDSEFMPGAPAAFQGPVSPSGAEAAIGFLQKTGGAVAYLESGGLSAAAIERAASLLV